TEFTAEYVWCHLKSVDSAWRFCFEFDQLPKFNFLTKSLADSYPTQVKDICENYFYLDFDRLLLALRLELELKFEQRGSLSDRELSLRLNSALTLSGFVESRAALQSAAADVLQEILRERQEAMKKYTCMDYEATCTFLVGSHSDGWGNNLTAINGRTDLDSDMDVVSLIPNKMFHLKSVCQCDGDPDPYELMNGHIQYFGF
uniref:Mab-21 domain-containing protein n=1 Tax=Macrostomum lignano TaxID=282301 RepID=A0A1I8GH66_9PLAT